MKKKKTWSITLTIILTILILGINGYIVYDKFLFNEKIKESTEKEEIKKLEKKALTIEEIYKIETHINNIENNAFILINYSNPEQILTKENVEILKYSINSSRFSQNADEKQKRIIWKENEAEVPTKISSLNDLSLFMKEKTYYEISLTTIKNAFISHYNEEINLYYYLISDILYEEHKITNGYKINNKIFITLDNNSKVVLKYKDNKYYFYSCDINY